MIRSGKLNKLISILEPVATASDSYGEPIATDSTFAGNVWAKVEPLTGREFFLANQTVSDLSIRFTIRFLSGVGQHMNVLYNGQKYDIKAIINTDERDEELQIMCGKVST